MEAKQRVKKPSKPEETPKKVAEPKGKDREFVLKMSHIMDAGLMYVPPFAYGMYLGHTPLRLAIGFVLQAISFAVLCVTVYGPFYPSSFYRAWDLVYRYQDLKCSDALVWDTLKPPANVEAPAPTAMLRWLLRLVLRKGSGFHLVLCLTSNNAFVVVPLVLIASYYFMMVERTGISDIQTLLVEIKRMVDEPPPPPRNREETMDEMDARQLKEIREGLDSTFGVGAPVAAAAILVWWLGERGIQFWDI
ncbi:hypothetical protein HDU78_001321 [Chytriomyces hyalinus]|nr:hypothetical protein HDU78_001321 [Chytriomyces hyalinus]KAJ3263281.1 hypothetical protein HDU77_010979 [Chytriomyces hyalinus]